MGNHDGRWAGYSGRLPFRQCCEHHHQPNPHTRRYADRRGVVAVSGDTRVAVLTPPGTGAIATVEVTGPRAWEFTRSLFRPAGKPLSDLPDLHRFWFGT